MSSRLPLILPLVIIATVLSGCSVIEGLLRIGFWAGVIVVVVVVAIAWYLTRMLRGRGTRGRV